MCYNIFRRYLYYNMICHLLGTKQNEINLNSHIYITHVDHDACRVKIDEISIRLTIDMIVLNVFLYVNDIFVFIVRMKLLE